MTGTHSHGQGHETTFAQIVADTLGMPIENIEVVHGDTDEDAVRHGHLWLALARRRRLGDRARHSTRSSTKAKRIAAHLMEASDADIEFKDGKFTVAGHRPVGSVRRRWHSTAYVPHNYPITELEPGLEEIGVLRSAQLHLSRRLPICEWRSIPRPA